MIKRLEVISGLFVDVYTDGRIRTLDRKNLRSNGRIDNRKGRFLRPTVNKYGYEQVTLTFRGVRKTIPVHRLVAIAFIDNPENKLTINHIDGDKLNNSVENLEWATMSEQRYHADITGLSSANTDALKASNIRRSIPVIFNGNAYDSIKQAARENGVHERVIRREGVMCNE